MDHVWIDLCYGGSWENVNGVLQYLPLPMNFELKLPLKKLTYKRLISLVSKKLSLEPLSGFRLSYLKKGKVYLLNDNEDVDRFMCYISVSEDVVTLYVVEPRSSEVGSGTGSNQLSSSAPVYGTHDVQLNNCYQQQNFFVQPQFHHQEISVPPYFQYQTQYQTHTTQLQQSQNPQLFPNPNLNQFTDPNVGFRIEQLDDDEETDDFDLSLYPELNYVSDQILGKSQEEEEEEEIDDFDLSQYPELNDVSDQIWGKSQEEEETAVAEEDVVEEEFMVVKEPVEQPFCNSYPEEEEEEEEEVPKEKKKKKKIRDYIVGVVKKEPREYNWNMPELLPIPEEELVKIPVDCYTKLIRIKKDDCFDTKEDLKIALYTKCVEDGYQLKVNKSNKDRFETKCRSDENCTWRVIAKRIKDCEMFQVTRFIDKHTCSRTQVFPHHRQANKKVLGGFLAELMFVNGRVYRGHEIMTDINARFKISISYSQAWRAKCYALELLRGSPEASFAQLPAYCHNLKLNNPGSVTHIKTDSDGRFELLFIAIGAAIRSFVTCMRPVIIVDAAHLKGRYLGTNLLAVGMDANNGILPIAYGVGKSETSDSWTWFMGHLRDCIGPISNLTIISDRANSIDSAIRRCFPDAFHGLCGVHLYRNLRTRSAGIKNHQWTYWKAVKAYREVDFNKHIIRLRRVLPQCAQTLEDVGFERWSRVHQLGARYGFMTSNSAESINALSRHSRKLPITMLMEFFRASIQQWYYKKRNHAETLERRVTPWTEKKITKRVVKSTSWRVKPCSNTLFEVFDNNLNGLVDLDARTCTCRKWQTSGYPCGHVIKVALHLNQDDSSIYARDCYTSEVYRQTYAEIVYPIPHPSEWDIPNDLQTVLPPVMDKRLPGRPKNRDRIPSKGEEKKTPTCSRCKESGHTRLTCDAPVPSQSSFPTPSKGKSKSQSQSKSKSQSQLSSPFGTINLGDF